MHMICQGLLYVSIPLLNCEYLTVICIIFQYILRYSFGKHCQKRNQYCKKVSSGFGQLKNQLNLGQKKKSNLDILISLINNSCCLMMRHIVLNRIAVLRSYKMFHYLQLFLIFNRNFVEFSIHFRFSYKITGKLLLLTLGSYP